MVLNVGDRVIFLHQSGVHGHREELLINATGVIKRASGQSTHVYVELDDHVLQNIFGDHIFLARSFELLDTVPEEPIDDLEVKQLWY